MRAALVLTLFLCMPPVVSATVLLPADFREIVSGSQIIVHGRVSDVRTEWTAGRRRIESIITVEATSVLRGAPAERIVFRVPGGQIGRYKSVMVGAPEFQRGEEVVLFLRAQGPSIPQVFGLNQGVFRVSVDSRTGRRTVAAPLLASEGQAPQRVARGAPERRPQPLSEFTATVRSVLEKGGAR
jgi:hypothetical protein